MAADKMPLPRAVRGEPQFLTRSQVTDLAAAARGYGIVVETLALTGLRYGEVAALRVGRVDLLRRRITVAESVTEVNGRAVLGAPKTHQRRTVPLPRALVDRLTAITAGRTADHLVFTAPKGGPLMLRSFRRHTFDPAVRAAGLDGLTPHDLRHTTASLAVASGANVNAVQRMLGHASAAMTLDVYAPLFDDELEALAAKMDAAAEAGAPSVRPEATVSPISRPATGL